MASIAQALAYVIGVGGIVAGGLVHNDGDTPVAVVLWLSGFGLGALLTITSFVVRALSGAMARLEHLEAEVGLLTRSRAADRWDDR